MSGAVHSSIIWSACLFVSSDIRSQAKAILCRIAGGMSNEASSGKNFFSSSGKSWYSTVVALLLAVGAFCRLASYDVELPSFGVPFVLAS